MNTTRQNGDRFDRAVDSFDSVLPRSVKSQSQDGSTVYYNLTDLTDSLRGGTCARAALSLFSLSVSPPCERIGQISQIVIHRIAVLRFAFDSTQSTAVKERSTVGQLGGVAA